MEILDAPISKLPRVGGVLEKLLKGIGIETCKALIFYFPYRFDDFSHHARIADLRAGMTVTIRGRVDMIANRRSRNRRMIVTESMISDESGSIKVVWFNQPFLIKNLYVGDDVSLSGKTNDAYYDLHLVSPAYEKIGKIGMTSLLHTDRLVPIYSLPASISQKQFRQLIRSALDVCAGKISETLPEDLLKKELLVGLERALWGIHFPEDAAQFDRARQRFAFEELFLLQLSNQSARRSFETMRAEPIPLDTRATKTFLSSLPFSFTSEQKSAAREILADMKKSVPMNRLLEGDVGSGKTVVAALAILNTVRAGYQCAFMAPTEVLAEQHVKTFASFFGDSRLTIALLTSSTYQLWNQELGITNQEGKKERAALLEAIQNGTVDVIIGTHALIQEKILFKHCALVVIDEQHRFGVRQRKLLKEKNGAGTMPHILSLSATPIPRSLALTVYGDLDISCIRHLPHGRKKIVTKIVPRAYREWTIDFLHKQVQCGRQAFIVCPIIDPSDTLALKSVKEEFKLLDETKYPDQQPKVLYHVTLVVRGPNDTEENGGIHLEGYFQSQEEASP